MGTFYFNYTLKGPGSEQVARALKGHRTFVTPKQNDCVVVFIETPFRQEIDPQLAVRLSGEFACPLLSVSVHDDDILFYELYRNGQLADEYNSAPDYFDPTRHPPRGPTGGDAALLCRVFGHGATDKVERILRSSSDTYIVELDRHRDLVVELNLSIYAVGMDFDYVMKDDFRPIIGISRADMIATE